MGNVNSPDLHPYVVCGLWGAEAAMRVHHNFHLNMQRIYDLSR